MKIYFALVFTILSFPVFAQSGNFEDDYLLTVESTTGESWVFRYGPCGFGKFIYGEDVDSTICGEANWAYDLTPDSLCCDTVIQDLSGKIAVARRGDCGVGIKTYYAEEAGAKGLIVLNHYNDSDQDSCSVLDMSSLLTHDWDIPAIILSRVASEVIEQLLDSGEMGEVCFAPISLHEAYGAYHYQTPLSQLDTLKHMGVLFQNTTTDTISNIALYNRITGPNGLDTTLISNHGPIPPNEKMALFSHSWMPPEVLGKYYLEFSTDLFLGSQDTLQKSFRISDGIFASDNATFWNTLFPSPQEHQLFIQGYLINQQGALYRTGGNSAVATHVQFGVSNADEIYTGPGNDEANSVYFLLFDGDSDGDGQVNLTADWSDLSTSPIGYGIYIIHGNEYPYGLICKRLEPFGDSLQSIELKPNHLYYLSILYDGNLAGTGDNISFASSVKESYYWQGGIPVTPMFLGQFYYDGFVDHTVIQRLILSEGNACDIMGNDEPIVIKGLEVFPNPATDILSIRIPKSEDLQQNTVISLFSGSGMQVKRVVVDASEGKLLRIPIGELASGAFILTVHSGDRYAVKPIVIAH